MPPAACTRVQRLAAPGGRLWVALACCVLIGATLWFPPRAVQAQSSAPTAGQQARAGQQAGAGQRAEVSPFLARELATADGPATFLVLLRDQPDPVAILQDAGATDSPRAERLSALYAGLTAQARASQASLAAWLDARQAPSRPYYIVNMLQVTGDAALVDELSQHPDVARIVSNPRVAQARVATLPATPFPGSAAPLEQAVACNGLPYGLAYTQAPQVWQMGYRGQGIVVASQDTGVEWDHPALLGAYRGWSAAGGTASHAYNWFDAWDIDDPNDACTGDAQIPCDDDDHGTHTVGTMAGDATASGGTAIGMAPDATWIGCRNMLNGFGTPASYTACFEFMLAPYPQGGDPFSQGRPELAPHVVNNSWSCPPREGCDADSLRQVVETARAAGIFVAASAGNSGSSCASVLYPIAIYDAVFSTGAHDASGSIAGFSSRGPVTADGSQRAKPDLSAPGVGVCSSRRGGGYSYLSGTSMASPHVAGAVALLWSAVPELVGEVDATEQVLIKSATPALANQCEEAVQPVAPNYTYGYGRLNVADAVSLAQSPATVTVTVRSTISGPVSGAEVTLVDGLTASRHVTVTDELGAATFSRIYAGLYEASTSVAGFSMRKTVNVQPGGQIEVELTDEPVHGLFVPYLVYAGD